MLMLNNQRGGFVLVFAVIVFVVLIAGGSFYFGTHYDKSANTMPKSLSPDVTKTSGTIPAATPSPMNTAEWKLTFVQKKPTDKTEDIRLVNTKTAEEIVIGQKLVFSAKNDAIISHDSSTVYFVESLLGSNKLTTQRISTYSIAQRKVTKSLTLGTIKTDFPNLTIPRDSAVLGNLTLSPNGKYLAFNYSLPGEFDGDSDIIIVNVSNDKITDSEVKGELTGWNDDATIKYKAKNTTADQSKGKIIDQISIVNIPALN